MKKESIKYLLIILLFCFAFNAHAQMCDSTIIHDTTTSITVQNFKDSSFNITISVTHDTTVYVRQKRWFIFYYYRTIAVAVPTTHDSSYKAKARVPYYTTYTSVIKTPPHDTLVKCKSIPQDPAVTHFGVLSAHRDMTAMLNAAKNLGVNYVRDGITLSRWNGISSWGIEQWLDNGYKIVLNINNDFANTYFPTNLSTYEKNLRSVLNVYNPEVVVIENEELNEYVPGEANANAHKGSLQTYINELTVAVKVCKEKDQPVTNAGLTNEVITSLYYYYLNNNKQDSIEWLKTQLGGISKDPVRLARCDSLLRAYKTLDLTYVNLHWYEPHRETGRITGILQTIINYVQQQTGKPVITNETGVRSDNPFYTTYLMTEWKAAGSALVIAYDSNGIGTGENAYPLTKPNGELLDNGKAFKNQNAITESEY